MGSRATLTTSGNEALDRELQDLRRLIDDTERRVSALEAAKGGVQAQAAPAATTAPRGIVVSEADGSNAGTVFVLQFDQVKGFTVTRSGMTSVVSQTDRVTSVESDGGTPIVDGVILKSGGGCTITQSGQTITISVP